MSWMSNKNERNVKINCFSLKQTNKNVFSKKETHRKTHWEFVKPQRIQNIVCQMIYLNFRFYLKIAMNTLQITIHIFFIVYTRKCTQILFVLVLVP